MEGFSIELLEEITKFLRLYNGDVYIEENYFIILYNKMIERNLLRFSN